MLSPDVIAYFDALDETFSTPGWAILVDEAKRRVYALQAEALEVKSWEEVVERRGRALQLDDLINMRDTAIIARKALEADAAAAEADEAPDAAV